MKGGREAAVNHTRDACLSVPGKGIQMNRRRFFLSAAASASLASFGARAASSNGPGVVRFGQSASMTGGQAGYGKDIRDGIAAAFGAASAQPGSPRFELATLDDGGVRNRCAENVNFLIESGVAGVIGLTSGTGVEACLPAIERAQVPLIGPATGSMAIRSSTVASTFHVRAGYDLEYRRMAAYVRSFGLRRVGVVTLHDASGVNLEAMKLAVMEMGSEPKAALTVDRNAANFDAVAAQLMEAKLDCVLFATNAAPAAAIIASMKAAKYPGLFYASSFAGQDLVSTMAGRKHSCIFSAVVPRPSSGSSAIVNKCQQDLTAYVPDGRMGLTTLEGYIAGRTAVEAARAALRASSGPLSRARLRESLAGLRADLGGYNVDFTGGTQGSRYVDLIVTDQYGRLLG